MLNNHAAYKYETPYKGLFVIILFFTNSTVNIQYGQIQIRHDIRWINPFKYDANIEDINHKNMCDYVNI